MGSPSSRARVRSGGGRAERGGAAVEFALVLPIFCAIVFGIIDYGWYFYERFSLAAAVRDGLRLAVTINQNTPSPNDPASKAVAEAMLDLTNAGMNPPNNTFTTSTSGASPLKTMTLSGTYTFTPLVHFVPLPANAMHYQMTMLFEQQ